jgi:hypothetical protein
MLEPAARCRPARDLLIHAGWCRAGWFGVLAHEPFGIAGGGRVQPRCARRPSRQLTASRTGARPSAPRRPPASWPSPYRGGLRPSLDPNAAYTPAHPCRKRGKTTSAPQNPSLDRPRSLIDDTEGSRWVSHPSMGGVTGSVIHEVLRPLGMPHYRVLDDQRLKLRARVEAWLRS